MASRASARHAGPDRVRRPVPAPAGRRHVPEPRTPAPGATARLLPRVHGAHARFALPRRAAHRIRRQPTGGVLLHRRPLPQLPPLRARGVGAMSAFELRARSEEHTSELQALMRISYAVFCLKKKNKTR